MFENVRADLRAAVQREPDRLHRLAAVVFQPGLHAVLLYRAARWCHLHHLRPLAVLLSYIGSVLTGAQLSPRAEIGKGLVIYHPHGTVIGATAVIGEYCTLVHGNVVGQLHGGDDRPVIGSHFVAGTGAKMLGRIRIGDRVRVGPNAVVTRSLPDGVTALGNPARVVPAASPTRSAVPPSRAAGERAPSASQAVILQRLVTLITETLDVATRSEPIGEDTGLLGQGIGLDSIEALKLIGAIEERFDLTIDERELEAWHLQTVGSLVEFIEKRLS